jgi:TolB-like protein/cytochrome c-type biogenesis protein CcmH/NrfG
VNPRNFFAELKRRNVLRAAAFYAASAWLLVQVATQVFPFFHIAEWVVRWIVVAACLGFPFAMLFSWFYEWTPHGLQRESEIAPNESITRQTGRKLDRWIIAILALAVVLLLANQFVLHRDDNKPAETAAVATPIPGKSIAVLPFENLSSDKENAYFADGIQDEILTKLASIADLKVISRISTAKYKSKPEDLKTVSQQLGVATVLEGTVQRANDKVRVNVQLIDARTDTHVWAKSYDRDVNDVFAVESEVAQEIADTLQAKLSPNEANTLATAPTKNSEAYDLFLKGEYEAREAETSLQGEPMDRAAGWYRQAVARDPNFALAIARLVQCRMLRHWYVEHVTDAELKELKRTAERSLTLAPKLAEAHIALGMVYYWGHRQYDEALAEFHQAIAFQPNNAQALEYSGYVHRRQGQWEQSLSELLKSQEANPREAELAGNIGISYCQVRKWKEAEAYGAHALALNPRSVDGIRASLISCLNGRGDIKEARRLLDAFPADVNLVADAGHANSDGLIGERAYICVLEKNYAAALRFFENSGNGIGERTRLSARAAIHVLTDDAPGASAEIEKARDLAEAGLRERPDDLDAMIQLSWINLALKRHSEALGAARRAVDLLPPEKDALVGTYTLFNLASIEARGGQASGAIDLLRRLLSMPAGMEVSIAGLKIDPVWDPIRNDPGFQQLLAGKEQIGPPSNSQ